MVKKITISLAIMLIMILSTQISIFADVLEINTNSPMFKTDNWQKTATIDYNLPKALNEGTIGDDNRFACIIQANQVDIQGEPVVINGSATCSIVIPFKETVNVDSFSIKFINPSRQYFFLVYASTDGENWTEVEITENAKKAEIGVTYNANGELSGPAATTYVSTPAGAATDGDVNLITYKLNTVKANYFKITFYGNDGAQDVLNVTHAWISFNNLKFDGSIFVEEVIEEIAAVVANAPVAQKVVAPQTSDLGLCISLIIVLLSATTLVVLKKSKSN